MRRTSWQHRLTGRLTGLTTRGRCILAAGLAAALCGIVLDERDLVRLATFAVVLPLLAAVVVGRTQVRLQAHRRLLPSRLPAGADAEVRLAVRSTSPLATGLLLEDTVAPVLGEHARFVVEQLPRGQAVQLRYPVRPLMRGIHPVGPLAARVTDPFGLVEAARELGGRQDLVAHPVVVSLQGRPGGSARGGGHQGSTGRRKTGQGEDDAVVRAYRHGDDMRKVHWRSTARRDELMVRVEEQPWRGGASVLLDHRITAHRGHGPDSSLEWAISMAASITVHLLRAGQQVRLVTVDEQPALGLDAGPDTGVDTVLDTLAALNPSGQQDLLAGRRVGDAQELIAVLGAVHAGDVETLLGARRRGGRAVLLDVDAWAAGDAANGAAPAAPLRDAARRLTDVGWTVTVATPESSMSAAWDELCSGVELAGPVTR